MLRTFAFLLTLFFFIQAQAQTASIQGGVKDPDGDPLSHVNIGVLGSTSGTTADDKGRFTLYGLPAGEHRLKVSRVGYKTVNKKVSLQEGDTVELELTLQPTALGMNEVVKSASREREILDRTPSSVSVVDRQEIEDQMVVHREMNDILGQTVPGMAQSTRSGSNFGQNLRGRPSLVMIDGIPQSTPLRDGERDLRTLDPSVVERIEVVKGANAIYGHGATGGFINYITREPAQEPFESSTSVNGNLSLTYPDSSEGYRINQSFSGTVGNFDYVLSGSYEKNGLWKDADGNIIPIDPQLQGGIPLSETWNGFGKLGYQIAPKHRVRLTYNVYSHQQNPVYRQVAGTVGEEPAEAVRQDPGVEEPRGTRGNHNANLSYVGKDVLSNTDLEANFYYQDFETVFSRSTLFKGGGQTMIRSEKKGGRVQLATDLEISEGIGTELVYGVDALNDVTSQPLLDGRLSAPPMDLFTVGPFLQSNTELGEHWTLKAGVRWENASIEVDDYRTVPQLNQVTDQFTVGGQEVQGGTLEYDALTYNAGLNYNRWAAFTPFVSYSKGFSLADLGRVLRTADENTLDKLRTEPVLVDNYEFGFRSAFEQFRLEINTFASHSELGASYRETETGDFVVSRSPELVYGAEASLRIQPSERFNMSFTYSYIEGKLDGNDNGAFFDEADPYLTGSRIAPPKFTQDASYKITEDWRIGISSLYSMDRDRFPNSDAFGEGSVEDYFITDLRSSYRMDPLTIEVGIENLFNADYYPAVSQWYNQAGFGYVKGPGRRIEVTLRMTL